MVQGVYRFAIRLAVVEKVEISGWVQVESVQRPILEMSSERP